MTGKPVERITAFGTSHLIVIVLLVVGAVVLVHVGGPPGTATSPTGSGSRWPSRCS